MNLLPVEFHNEKVYGVNDDFLHAFFATGVAGDNGWTSTHAVGAITMGDARGGQMVMTASGADDEFMSHLTTNEIFEFVSGKPIRFLARWDASTADESLDEMNVWAGCMEDMNTTDEILDACAGPRADSDMFGFFKAGTTGAAVPPLFNPNLWQCVSSFGALQQITELSAANPLNLSGEDQKPFSPTTAFARAAELIAEWVPTNFVPGVAAAAPTLLDAEVRFWINGRLVAKHQQVGAFQITIAGTEEMNFGVVTRQSAAQASVCRWGQVKCEQVR